MDADCLREKILKILTQKGISISKAESLSGIGKSSLRHFMIGKTKKPSIETLHALSMVLETDVADLISSGVSKRQSIPPEFYDALWSDKVFIKIAENLSKSLKKQKMSIKNSEAIPLLQDVYYYCMSKDGDNIEEHFNEWFFKRTLSS